MQIDALLKYGYQNTPVPVYYGGNALGMLRELTKGHKVLVVSDETCIVAAAAALKNIAVCDTVIFENGTEPDEDAVFTVRQTLSDCSLIAAIGSKTITDIAKYAAYLSGLDYIAVPTAPSTGTYVSEYCDIYIKKRREFVKAKRALAVVADSDILIKSPAVLKIAGYGALLNLAVEALERLICGAVIFKTGFTDNGGVTEEQTGEIRALKLCRKELDKNSLNSEKGIAALLGCLLTAQNIKEQTPGSAGYNGGGKLISDFIQGFCYSQNKRGIEGETLGYGAFIIKSLMPLINLRVRSRLMFSPSFSFKAWETKINATFPAFAASKIIAGEKLTKYNSAESRKKRLSAVFSSAPEILKSLNLIKNLEECFLFYEKEGGILSYKKLGITASCIKSAVLFSKDLSGGFSLLQLASDLNILTDFAASGFR